MITTNGRSVLAAAALAILTATGAYAAMPDPWITTKAKIALLTDDDVHASGINVDTIDGDVTLHGKVESAAEKAAAERLVREIDGVGDVRNLLQVVPARREQVVAASDREIETRVEDALAQHEALRDVTVRSVNDGVVLLGGDVRGLGSHLSAVLVTADVPGVRRVATEIRSPDRLGDEEIAAERQPPPVPEWGMADTMSDLWTTSAVKLRLLADTRTPGLDVNVDTTDGTVTLFGIVDSAAARTAAEENARKVSTVKAVVNDLQVVPAAREEVVKARDADVRAGMEDALAQRTDLREADIDVDVQNGVARLTGTVPSESQRLMAAVVARTATGVRAVRDDLRVEAN